MQEGKSHTGLSENPIKITVATLDIPGSISEYFFPELGGEAEPFFLQEEGSVCGYWVFRLLGVSGWGTWLNPISQ